MNRVFIIILLLIAVPIAVFAAQPNKKHRATDNQECADCHIDQGEVWLYGKHGLMNVKCVVCHGSPEENFVAKPAMARCRGCHGDKVADVDATRGKIKTCFVCHDHHTVALIPSATVKTGFHSQGGSK